MPPNKKSEVITNMRILKPSRKRLSEGDIFTFQMPDGLFRYGRVIETNAQKMGMILIYVFRSSSKHKEQIPETIGPDDLLLRPTFINRLPWSRGYFETVTHRELQRGDTLPRHVFRWQLQGAKPRYYDEFDNEVPEPTGGIIGSHELYSFRTIDDEISKALGFELAPD